MKLWFPYLLVAPAVIYLMLITLYPGIFAIVQSFYAVKFGPWKPVGFDNYIRLFNDYQFWGALWNTFVIGSISLALQCVHRACAGLLRLPRPLGAGLAHRLPRTDAVHAVGGGLHLQARLPRCARLLRHPHPARPDRDEPRHPVLRLDEPRAADPRRRLAMDAVPVHHLCRRPAGAG